MYEACADLGLHVHVHPAVASSGPAGSGNVVLRDGVRDLLEIHDAMHHITSLIVNGVFKKYPNLRFVIKEYGSGGSPTSMWRLDCQL